MYIIITGQELLAGYIVILQKVFICFLARDRSLRICAESGENVYSGDRGSYECTKTDRLIDM